MADTLPLTIGAALPVHRLEEFRDWLFEKDRDLELQTFHAAEILNGDWRSLADQTNAVLDGHKGRIGIHGPFWGFDLCSKDPEIRAIVTKRMMQGLDVCAAVGARQMVIHSPFNPWIYNNALAFVGGAQWVYDETHATLDSVVKRAEDQGVVLVIENIADKDVHVRVDLARSFNSDAVQVSVDTGHAHLAHGSQGAHPVDYFIRAAGDMLAHVHIQDADGHADRHWAIGEGNILWPSVFRAIAEVPSNPHVVLELRDHAGIPASMTYLEEAGLAQ
ncbi:MAG: sugar phosphate isomerase/epimerase family protein [Pseudomonadota bacterium]